MAEEDDSNNWKGTGLHRDKVRQDWEAIPKDTRPSWVKFVQIKREEFERSQKRSEFEKVLEGYLGIKITLPQDLLEVWLQHSSSYAPLKVIDSTRVSHKVVYYRLLPQQKEALETLWKDWKGSKAPAA